MKRNEQVDRKMCSRCYTVKSIGEFYDRPGSICKKCQTKYSKVHSHKYKYRKYNLTEEEVIEQGDQQGWLCYICERDISDKPFVDHDHATGLFRKLLCHHCNTGLGFFHDSPVLLGKAIGYILEHEDQDQ